MLDFDRCDPRVFELANSVLKGLVAAHPGLKTDQTMLVGAACRDILHSAQGHDFVLRETNDVDVGIAIADWSIYEELTARLGQPGANGIRYVLSGIPVDLLPFGEVEKPRGIVTPASRPDGLNVIGFDDVFATASLIDLGSQITTAVPTVSGYSALKFAAWADRSDYGEFKDGSDIATAIYWYYHSSDIKNRLYETQEGQDLLIRNEMDLLLASASQLGRDAVAGLRSESALEFRRIWNASRLDLLPTYLLDESLPNWPSDLSRRGEIAEALTRGVREGRARS